MGSCLSKQSSKGHKKKKKKKSEAHHEETIDSPEQEKQAWKASAKRSREELGEVELSSPLSTKQAVQKPSPDPLTTIDDAIQHYEPRHPSTSPSAQKSCPSLVLSTDYATFPISAQTPISKKHSGEFPVNPLRKPSSPCKALLLKLPSSPASMKKSTSLHVTEEDECKFPSLARKQWLSQAYATKSSGLDDPLPTGSMCKMEEDVLKGKIHSNREIPASTRREIINAGSKLLGQQSLNRPLNSEAPNGTNKAATSRTNSFSRDLSPVEISRAKARPSSPLKRSPSIKDYSSAADGSSRLIRSSSGKVSSPNRAGYHVGERPESLKARGLRNQSLSKEYLPDPASDPLAHKRSSSRDSMSEFSAEIIRKPSPPKKAPVVVPFTTSSVSSSLEAGRPNVKRPSTPSKDNLPAHKSLIQESSPLVKGVTVKAQRSLNAAVHEIENMTNSNNKSGRRKEKSPVRRSCNVIATRSSDRLADLSINSDTAAANQLDSLAKDTVVRTRRPTSRNPLRELSDNVVKSFPSKPGLKENRGAATKPSDILHGFKENCRQELQQERAIKGCFPSGKTDETVLCNLSSALSDHVKDPLEVKAESLVMEGKSVLSAFKALEEYRSKHSHLSFDSHQKTEQDVCYSRSQAPLPDKDNFSQPLPGSKRGNTLSTSDFQSTEELPRSRSAKKSNEKFIFPDVQSLLASENEGFRLEAGMTIPASISKACSILRAVADLNMGSSTYPSKKEAHDEIEHPKFLSFQFGEGDSDRVTSS